MQISFDGTTGASSLTWSSRKHAPEASRTRSHASGAGAKPPAGAGPASQTASSSRRPMRMPGPGPWKRTARVMCSPGRGTGGRFSQGRHASATIARMTRTPVQGTTPVGAYSPGIIAEGRFLYVSGQGPLIDGKYDPASAEEETRLTLENIGRILASAGAGFDDVVRCGCFLADINDFNAMNGVYATYFSEPRPARTTVQVAALPGGIKVEIDCVVLLP